VENRGKWWEIGGTTAEYDGLWRTSPTINILCGGYNVGIKYIYILHSI